MNKTKIKNIALLFTVLLFIASLALSVITMFRAKAEDPIADVPFDFKAYGDLTHETETVYGVSMETYGNTVGGWGGWLKYLVIDSETGIDASGIAGSGKGALSFWLYIADENTLTAYKNSAQTTSWNVDVCSAENYNDTNKYSFNVANNKCAAFQDLRLGWQRVVLPFGAADEKNQIDWTTVRQFRFNQNVPGGKNNIKVGGFSFTTTNLTKYTVTGDPVTEFGIDYDTSYAVVGSKATITQLDNEELGEKLDAYGRPNEGGFVTVLKLDKAYSVEKVSDSAFSVWVYAKTENDLKTGNSYNIDVSSGANYSDSSKYSFNIAKLFSKCKAGWNHIIVPLESADEKNNMDWADVQNIRLNAGGGAAWYLLTAKYEIIHSGVTEPTVVGWVEPTEPEPDRTQTFTEDGGIVTFSENLGGLMSNTTVAALDAIKQLDKDTTAQYVFANMNGSWSTWGGIVRATVLDRPYNVGAVSTNPKGAFVFWLYIHNQTTLDTMKSGVGFNLNLSSGESFSDAKKWEYNISPLAKDMMIGWNKIIIPFSSSMCVKHGGGPETANTVQNIRFVALDGKGGGEADVAFADFGFFLTDETQPVVVNQKTQMQKPDDVSFGVGDFDDFAKDEALLTVNGKAVPAYSAIGKNWGKNDQLITFDKAYDLSNHNMYGKSVLSFGLYIADEATLDAHRAMTEGYVVTLASGSEYAAAQGYAFDISPLFADCSVGWNTFNLPVDTADSKGAIDWANVKFLQIAWNKAFGEGECEVAFAQFALISTEETARSVENDTGVSLGVLSVEEFDKVTLVRSKKNITAYSIIGKDWGRFAMKKVELAKTYNATKFSENGAVAFWLYIENENTLNAYRGTTGGWTVAAYSGAYKGENKLTFEIHSLFKDCIVGWNYIVLPVAAGTNSNFDFAALSSLGVECEGKDVAASVTEGKNKIALAQFAVIATDLKAMTVAETISNIEEGLNPIAEKIIIDCNLTNGITFSGNKVDTQDFRYGTGSVYTSGAGYALNAQIDVGDTDLRKPTLILAFWLWIEDPAYYFEADGTTLKSGINGQIELASSQPWDTNEINWELRQWGLEKMQKGWNWIVLKGADGNISGGDPNYDALMRFRIYVNGIQQSTMKIDRITIGSSEKLLTAPDWEKEVIKPDDDTGFKGPNAYAPSNDTYLGVDFDNDAKGFTVRVKETVTKTVDGCNSFVTTVPVAIAMLVGAAVTCALLVLKKKNDQK